ncbi:MAG: serine/threonine phosphatase [Oscillatoriaceae bacterium SKW80]|nr:serine/threonine phosphatase [Oscillatoriaceae bacterium SKYG93]MCX8120403.1 serine/threonine phosphatase [Oscillatoriaceae bacterium SKW80]MDW8452801.1 serine/threonine phosphatase [Oscillatoriaceae cyanobacterium SKYGB_i_bin93]HIK28071.1 serine/threonine phosphatase [Oscillatoriaceae cyanobacterium M7585_C2015_266]
MLICPKCQSKNPQQNKFCQECGTSLTQKTCPECKTVVALNALNCHNCGTPVGTVWRAILSRRRIGITAKAAVEASPALVTSYQQQLATREENEEQSYCLDVDKDKDDKDNDREWQESEKPVEKSNLEETASETNTESGCNSAISSKISKIDSTIEKTYIQTLPGIPAGAFLDAQKRYQLLEPLPPRASASATDVEVKVLDCNPFLMSPLKTFVASKNAGKTEKQADNQEVIEAAIPQIAEPYLALGKKFYPHLPVIHDAWEQKEETVLLLEERSDLDKLTEKWSDENIDSIQLLQWLYDMTELWAALEPWKCRQSILEEENLRVNPEQFFCIRRLYFEKPDSNLEVHDLGEIWQLLFQKSQRTQIGSVTELLADLRCRQIQTIEELRARLKAILDELETSSTSSVENYSDDDEDTPTIVLPMQLVGLDYVGRTDIGCQRDHNEDSFGIETDIKSTEGPLGRTVRAKCVYILCDGMGGHASGEVASAMAVDTLRHYFQTHWGEQMPSEATIREAVLLANQVIYDKNQSEKNYGSGRMGTTLVLVLQQNTHFAVAHVGDSRLYRLSQRQGLVQVTTDHEVGQREIQRGYPEEVAYSRPDAYQLTQALGPRDQDFINPDVQFFDLNEDTLLILASDGLTDNNLLENNWKTHLLPLLSPEASLTQGVDRLIDLANQYNGHDNITAILIRAFVKPSKI